MWLLSLLGMNVCQWVGSPYVLLCPHLLCLHGLLPPPQLHSSLVSQPQILDAAWYEISWLANNLFTQRIYECLRMRDIAGLLL